jgi:hypothetical protein
LKTSDYIRLKIDRLPKGYIFTYENILTEVNKKEAVIKSLNRMVASGAIKKLSRGKYYKPESTVFGVLLPDQYQVVKDLLEKDDKLIGYITGYGVYNQMGLTTQVSNTIQIGKNEPRPFIKRGMYKISFTKQRNNITRENIPLLQLLDAIRYIKAIPDTTIDASCKRIMAIIKSLTADDQSLLVKLAVKYPPSTKALLGAMMEALLLDLRFEVLRKSLNPITVYKLSVSRSVLPSAENWNIK